MTRPANILVVDDDHVMIAALHDILAPMGTIRFATNGDEALRLAVESPPDVVLLDIEMAGMSGLDVCIALKREPTLQHVPVIFVTSHSSVDQELAGFAAGAVDFISKPPSPPLVEARVRTHLRLKEATDALRETAITDGLTGIANRRRFDEALAQEWSRAMRTAAPIALLLIDVDFFKRFNDRHGHREGDRCLNAVAKALAAATHRSTDLAARYGGEEFAVLLPDTSSEGAERVALRMLDAVDALAIPHADSAAAEHVSISVGVAAYRGVQGESADLRSTGARQALLPDTLVLAADKALYAAKWAGRHQAQYLSIDAAPSVAARPIRRGVAPIVVSQIKGPQRA